MDIRDLCRGKAIVGVVILLSIIWSGYSSTSTSSKNLGFWRSSDNADKVIVVVHERGGEMLDWTPSVVSISPAYTGRIQWRVVPSDTGTTLKVTLLHVTQGDYGHYECHDGAIAGPVIAGCGITLQEGNTGYRGAAVLILVIVLGLLTALYRLW